MNGSDPVKIGLVSSLNRPDGNITGVSLYSVALAQKHSVALAQKRLALLRGLAGNAATVAVLVNPSFSDTAPQLADVQAAASALGQKLIVLTATGLTDF